MVGMGPMSTEIKPLRFLGGKKIQRCQISRSNAVCQEGYTDSRLRNASTSLTCVFHTISNRRRSSCSRLRRCFASRSISRPSCK